MHQQQTALENIEGKGEIARNKQFLLFPQCFPLNQIIVSPFVYIFHIISLFAAEFEEPKIGVSGIGLNLNCPYPAILTPFHTRYFPFACNKIFHKISKIWMNFRV